MVCNLKGRATLSPKTIDSTLPPKPSILSLLPMNDAIRSLKSQMVTKTKLPEPRFMIQSFNADNLIEPMIIIRLYVSLPSS